MPTQKPTARLVPTARAGASPSQRIIAGMRRLPRMRPTRPPRRPMPRPIPIVAARPPCRGAPAVGFGRSRSIPKYRSATPITIKSPSRDSSPEMRPPITAPAIDGTTSQANRRQSTRRARMWATDAVAAATAEIPMFAPAPAAGDDASARANGSRMLPSTSPASPPASATVKHQSANAASSRGSSFTATRKDRRGLRHQQLRGVARVDPHRDLRARQKAADRDARDHLAVRDLVRLAPVERDAQLELGLRVLVDRLTGRPDRHHHRQAALTDLQEAPRLFTLLGQIDHERRLRACSRKVRAGSVSTAYHARMFCRPCAETGPPRPGVNGARRPASYK